MNEESARQASYAPKRCGSPLFYDMKIM